MNKYFIILYIVVLAYFLIGLYGVMDVRTRKDTWLPEFKKESSKPAIWIALLFVYPIRKILSIIL
jgi:hypothetical protein